MLLLRDCPARLSLHALEKAHRADVALFPCASRCTKAGMLAFQRADFLGVLLEHLVPQRCRTQAGKQLTTYHQSSSTPIVLEFEDGSRATCDILVGADGVASAVRRALAAELADAYEPGEDECKDNDEEAQARERARIRAAGGASYSGTLMYRATIPADLVRATAPDHPALESPRVVRTAIPLTCHYWAYPHFQYLGKDAVSGLCIVYSDARTR